MSTLSAARADNFYYPPNWDPSSSSLSAYTKQKGRNQYEQRGVIRLELPFDCWCSKCSRHLAKGKRFNAKKEANGKYHTTQLWKFEFKCPSCDAPFELRTDPANSDYAVAGALRRKVEEYDGQVIIDTDHRVKKSGPIERLEKKQDDLNFRASLSLAIEKNRDDALSNSLARRRHRTKRKAEQALDERARRLGLQCRLLPVDQQDSMPAAVFSRPASRTEPKSRIPPSLFASRAPTKSKLSIAANLKLKPRQM